MNIVLTYVEFTWGVAVHRDRCAASEVASVSDQDSSGLGADEITAMWGDVRNDAIDVPHLGDWVLDGNVRALLDLW